MVELAPTCCFALFREELERTRQKRERRKAGSMTGAGAVEVMAVMVMNVVVKAVIKWMHSQELFLSHAYRIGRVSLPMLSGGFYPKYSSVTYVHYTPMFMHFVSQLLCILNHGVGYSRVHYSHLG